MKSASERMTGMAQRANCFNFDELINVLEEWTPAEVRRHLMAIYFSATQAIFANRSFLNESAGDSFLVLQEIIEALDRANDTVAAPLAVTVK